jgi:hemerythrin-like domain-containing protein
MADTVQRTGCDVSDMVVIHNLFRKVLAQAPTLIGSVKVGDTGRAAIVADYLNELIFGLHNHHRGEDLLLWDDLAKRAPSCGIHVELMKRQHADVGEILDRLEKLLPEWRTTASAVQSTAISATVAELSTTLFEHLNQEQDKILPVAATAFDQKEWDKLGEHARAAIPRDRQFIQLGSIINSMEPAESQAWVAKNLPAPVRLLYKLIGRKQYDAYQKRLFPDAAAT